MNSSLPNQFRRGEGGQMLVLFVLALGVLMGFAALAIDVGLIFRERSQLSTAADAAALAAAQALSDSPFTAVAMAQQYAEANGVDPTNPGYAFEASTPYQGDPSKIEVKVTQRVDFLFGRVLGLTSVDVSGRAVAEATSSHGGGGAYAILALNTDCSVSDPLEFSGSTIGVVGGVHSNSTTKITGSSNIFDGGMTHTCSFENSGSNNTYQPPPAQSGALPDPLGYTFGSFPCTYTWNVDTDLNSHPEVWLNGDKDTGQLLDGVYCSTQDIQLTGQGITGTVTLVVGDEVKLSGSDFNLTGNFGGVLAFSAASHDSAIDLSGSGGNWTGLIYAPDGRVKVQGSNNLGISGGVVADRVNVSGSSFSFSAQGFGQGGGGAISVRLIE